jgi:hypothetical protein
LGLDTTPCAYGANGGDAALRFGKSLPNIHAILAIGFTCAEQRRGPGIEVNDRKRNNEE